MWRQSAYNMVKINSVMQSQNSVTAYFSPSSVMLTFPHLRLYRLDVTPVNTKHLYNICTMLDQRRRQMTLYKCYANVMQMCLLGRPLIC